MVKLVEAHTRTGRVELQIEGGGFHRLLFLTRQPRKAIGERICDPEIPSGHREHLHHLVAEMIDDFDRDPAGLRFRKRARVSLLRLAQASSSISALSVVFSAL